MLLRYPIHVCLAATVLSVGAGCRYDPVIADRIRQLPLEDADGPRPEHRAGQPCVDCHGKYEGAKPELALGGTVFSQTGKGFLNPVEGVFVTIKDSAGATYKACSNSAGNFFITKADLQGIDDFAFPLTVRVGGAPMQSLIGRERSCAGCHKLASIARIDADQFVDPSTGRARDSAGAIVIDPTQVGLLEKCGTQKGSSSSSTGGGTGGSGMGGSGMGGSGGMSGSTGMGGKGGSP
jgi:uncharacterized membrane protein YgcG